MILLLFLHTWRSTLIVMISIPTSVLTTFGLMYLLGLNLNLFSMLAITLAVGILVDDSIVVIENISRHLALREAPFVAAISGRNEIGLAALTITMVDVVVYVPITMIPSIAGGFIGPFAVVIAAATLTSLVVSFTLTPLLASRYLSLGDAIKTGTGPLLRFGRWWDGWFEQLEGGYRSLLHGVLYRRVLWGRIGMRWAVIALGLASLGGGLLILTSGRVGVNIFPSGDQSEVDVTLTMPSASTIETTDAVAKQLEQRLTAYPEVRGVYSSVSGDSAQIYAMLVPTTSRQRSSIALADVFRNEIGQGIPGATVRTGVPNAFGFGGSSQAIQIAVAGPNPEVLNALVDQVTSVVQNTPGAVNVNNTNQHVMAQYTVSVDRARAADLGVTAQSAAASLGAAVNGVKVASFQRVGQSNIDIRLIAGDQFRASPQNLAGLPLQTANGTNVSLGQLGTINQTAAPTSIAHYNRVRSVTIYASNSTAVSSGTLQSTIQSSLNGVVLPPGYSVTFGGVTQIGAAAFTSIFSALAVSIGLMYMLMMLLFRSVTLPLAVLMSLPLAAIGALGAMALTGTDFTLFSLLGLSLLIGLVGKNAILLVDYTDTLRKRGSGRTEALLDAAPTRLRPILMTTLSIMVALLPIALGIEVGSELLRAAAIVLIGGLTTSTLLTLVFVPAMYTIFDDLEAAFVRVVHRVAQPRPLEPEELAILHALPREEVMPDTKAA
ncbi:MAG: efflux RND transporter permease subunit [Chloroflexota bacterium]|nr:efflux RND transporter permease subunit [Chloroflexota bacterium]